MLYIFDFNGTLVNTPFVDKMPLALLPGRKEKIAELQAQGHICAIASNQGGVAFGILSEAEATEEVGKIARELNILHFKVAFGHPSPKRGYEEYGTRSHLHRRKPGPGMIEELIKETGATKIWMIGDRDEDQGAATAARESGHDVTFAWTADFFGNDQEHLWKIFQLLQRSATAHGDEVSLVLASNGQGAIGWPGYINWCSWASLQEAPAVIEQALHEYERMQEAKKQAAGAPDDFDPFLDEGDLP